MIIGKISNPTLNAEAVALRTNTLQWAEVSANSIHRGVATTLLGKPQSELATFSFDGKYAGQIRLGSMFNEENQSRWEYSIDGGRTWTETDKLYVQLTPTELLGINEKDHIRVHVVGTEIRSTIQIDKTELTISNIDICANDAEDAFYLYNTNRKIEWKYKDDVSGASAWKSYDEVKPNLSGNRGIQIRFSATGTKIPVDFIEFNFTDNKYKANETYIKTKYLSIADSTPSGKNTPAKNMIDGNYGIWNNFLYHHDFSRWLSANKTDENKFITIELKEPVYLSRLDYIPSDEECNEAYKPKPFHGRIMKGEILGSMDGENWTKLGDITNWANNSSMKTVRFTNPQKVKYVKVVATQTNDGYIGGRGFNLYEDTTKEAPPTATVKYSTIKTTSKDVVATLENFSSDTIVVENGITSYTFTENGAYTFNLSDPATGRTNEIVASVDWIDRVKPTADIQYINLPNTKGHVQARIVNISKNVFVLDEQGRPIRFIQNTGNYVYEFNFNPDTKQIINMVQKDKNNNIRYVKGYKLRDPNKPITDPLEDSSKEFTQMGYPAGTPYPEDKEYMIAYQANYTNGNITAEAVFNENYKIVTSQYTEEQVAELRTYYTTGIKDDVLKYVFTKNGEKIYKLRDRIGNEAEIKMVVDSINRGPYIAEVSYDKEGPTNGDVTATLTFKEEGVRITNLDEGVVETSNGGKYIFTENGEFRFKLIDSENVESYLDAKVSTIDKQVPQGIITYSTTSPTNGNVTATIDFDKTNVTITNNEGKGTHTFTDNGNFTFEFIDEAGNVGTAIATVECIDRTTPTAQISYSTTSPTNQDVVASIVDSNKDITITNNDGESVYTFTKNGDFIFEFVDEAGNVGTATATVDWIDKEEIIPTINYRINAPTGKAETAIISFNKANITITNNNGKNTHRFENNGEFVFEFRDEAGNTGTAKAIVTWIDKEFPTAEVHYDRTTGTKDSVTVTLVNPSKEITITNNGGKNAYTFTQNGKFIFEYEDKAGNLGETMAEVTWIDKEAPKATITYSTTEDTTDPVIATLHLEDPNMGTLPATQTYTFTKNGEYIFNFEDSLGNKGTKTAIVNWIQSGNLTADIKYEKTENGVLATLVNESRDITVTNNGGNRTYLLTEQNNTFTFEYVDTFGNTGRTEAKYENMNGPATIDYNINSSFTMVDGKRKVVVKVKAKLNLPTGYKMKKYGASTTYTFSEKGNYTFEYINTETNQEYKATATVDWFPEASYEISTTELTKDTVDLILHFNKDGEELHLDNDLTLNAPVSSTYPHPLHYYMEKKEGTNNVYTFKHNVSLTLVFSYQGQRLLSVPVSINNIDDVEPVGTIKYSNTEPTYRNVTATIEFNKSNVNILNNDGKDTFRFEQNGNFIFEYEDAVGHRGTATANVDWILEDSEDVVPTIIYSEKEPTNQDVVATITFDQDDVRIVDEQGNEIPDGDVYRFTQNGTHVFNYIDKKGKNGVATAEVNNIDKDVPVATINYSTTEKTNKPVTATITFNEENVTVEGGSTHVFDDSGSYTFNFIDQAGNRGTAVAEVNWIRKTLPNATITYDETELTCRDVTASISFDLENVVIIDEEGTIIPNGDKYVFTENGTHIFRFRGPYGNEGSAVARVNYIDKVLPVPTITYDVENQTSGSVTATITFDKRNVTVEGGNKHVFTENGEHTFNFMDEAGNKGWALAKVTWIDSDLPIATITYNPERPAGTGKVNTDVVATISFDQENVKIVNNGGSNQYTFTQNGQYEFAFENANGERGTALASVSWIDKEVPVPTITYSTQEPTNGDVTATITFDKENVTVEGGNTHTFTENGEYEFRFVGPSGNRGTAKAIVNWIDKVAPEATITYSPESSTNEEVVATITFNEEDVTITNNEGKNTYTFTKNSEFTFEYRDKAGNTGSKLAKVTWIDKEALVATINYNINELTNKDVIATISFNKENVTVKNGRTHIFIENGEYTFEYEDTAGNKGSKLAKVNWIDKKAPVGTITYSTTNPTNQNVTANISFNKENVTITNNDGNNTYTFTDNSEFTFEFVDKAGNIGTAKAHVDWIDRKLPVATITYDINTLTNHDVIATITFDKNNVVVEGGNTHTFTENGEYEFAFVGPAGNIGTAIAKVTWIDKKVPNATINYSTTNPTNGEVKATITFDKENVIVEGGNVHTFTDNGEFTFRFIDEAGNTGTKLAKVTWIDKTLPKATIAYSTKELTNQNVIATITFDKENVRITNNNGSNEYTFTKNGKFEFEFVGPSGNRGTAIAEVNCIDKDVPIAIISYDITTPTNQNVTATITFNEENVTVKDGNTHVFEDSGEYTFEFVDRAGNRGSATARVDWIKKTLPNATFEYSIEALTNQDVTVTVNFDREGTRVTNNDGKNTYTFTKNGSFTFEFVGPYGNAGVATANVDWIDKDAPVPTITYSTQEMTNQDVIATINFNKEGVTVKGGNTHVFEDSGEYTFEFVDRAGNSGTAVAKVDWLKKTLPNATITYSTTNPTNQDVIATITFDIEGVIVLGGNTHRFTQNGTYLFEFVGPYGNKGTAIAEVDWIDKVEPNATITYSTTNPTNGSVVATVTFDKENVRITNNDGKNTYTFTENGDFEFEYVGPAGNTGVAIASVNWIDKTLPKATITYDKLNLTNQNVTATITFDKENVRITNNDGNNQYTFTENGEFEFEFIGPAGNIGTAIAKVTWIDKILPVAEIRYSIENPTNQPVIATISFNEEDVTVEGGNTHTFTENGEYIFKYQDKAGNQGAKLAKVTWIDKTLPKATITYDINGLTNQDVIATITFDKENVRITNNNGNNQYTFTENGQFEFKFIGPAGNTGFAIASVNWIDKVAPTAKVTYDITTETEGSVVATLDSASEEITITNNGGNNTYIFTKNGAFTFEFVDKAGNKGTAEATVNWIKTAEDKYQELKAIAIAKIKDYKNTVTEDELDNKKINAGVKNEVIAAYDSLRDEDKAEYTEFINKIKQGGKPTITKSSTEEIKYKVGETIDLYSLITIEDNEDEEIEANEENVKITTNLNAQKAGTYDVTYEVTDSDGNKTSLTIQIIIEEEVGGFEITSSKYNIKDHMILNISQMTTVDEFK